jgi:hypothetical protein
MAGKHEGQNGPRIQALFVRFNGFAMTLMSVFGDSVTAL